MVFKLSSVCLHFIQQILLSIFITCQALLDLGIHADQETQTLTLKWKKKPTQMNKHFRLVRFRSV